MNNLSSFNDSKNILYLNKIIPREVLAFIIELAKYGKTKKKYQLLNRKIREEYIFTICGAAELLSFAVNVSFVVSSDTICFKNDYSFSQYEDRDILLTYGGECGNTFIINRDILLISFVRILLSILTGEGECKKKINREIAGVFLTLGAEDLILLEKNGGDVDNYISAAQLLDRLKNIQKKCGKRDIIFEGAFDVVCKVYHFV